MAIIPYLPSLQKLVELGIFRENRRALTSGGFGFDRATFAQELPQQEDFMHLFLRNNGDVMKVVANLGLCVF